MDLMLEDRSRTDVHRGGEKMGSSITITGVRASLLAALSTVLSTPSQAGSLADLDAKHGFQMAILGTSATKIGDCEVDISLWKIGTSYGFFRPAASDELSGAIELFPIFQRDFVANVDFFQLQWPKCAALVTDSMRQSYIVLNSVEGYCLDSWHLDVWNDQLAGIDLNHTLKPRRACLANSDLIESMFHAYGTPAKKAGQLPDASDGYCRSCIYTWTGNTTIAYAMALVADDDYEQPRTRWFVEFEDRAYADACVADQKRREDAAQNARQQRLQDGL